jgi:hypothetical protein
VRCARAHGCRHRGNVPGGRARKIICADGPLRSIPTPRGAATLVAARATVAAGSECFGVAASAGGGGCKRSCMSRLAVQRESEPLPRDTLGGRDFVGGTAPRLLSLGRGREAQHQTKVSWAIAVVSCVAVLEATAGARNVHRNTVHQRCAPSVGRSRDESLIRTAFVGEAVSGLTPVRCRVRNLIYGKRERHSLEGRRARTRRLPPADSLQTASLQTFLVTPATPPSV